MQLTKIVGNRLLIQPIPDGKTTFGGIVLPDTYRPRLTHEQRSVVIALGSAYRGELRPDDIVIHNAQFGFPVPGTDYLIIDPERIVAKEEFAAT